MKILNPCENGPHVFCLERLIFIVPHYADYQWQLLLNAEQIHRTESVTNLKLPPSSMT